MVVVIGDAGRFEIRYGGSYITVTYDIPRGLIRIDAVEVVKKERGKGLGSALVGIVEDIARLLGIKVVYTATVLRESRGFWESLGYRPVQPLKYVPPNARLLVPYYKVLGGGTNGEADVQEGDG